MHRTFAGHEFDKREFDSTSHEFDRVDFSHDLTGLKSEMTGLRDEVRGVKLGRGRRSSNLGAFAEKLK